MSVVEVDVVGAIIGNTELYDGEKAACLIELNRRFVEGSAASSMAIDWLDEKGRCQLCGAEKRYKTVKDYHPEVNRSEDYGYFYCPDCEVD